MRHKFGIDIDGTVTDPASLVPFINEAFALNLQYEDVNEYDLLKVLDLPRSIFEDWYKKKESEIYSLSPLATGAKETLLEWANIHELIFISARGRQHLDVTIKWLLQNGINYRHVELIGSHDKIAAATSHKVDIFFEDKLDNALAIHNALHIPVILFDTPYNQSPLPSGVIRVLHWQEAKDWVEQWIKKRL